MIHTLGKKHTTVFYEGCTHEELTSWVANNEAINNFIGCVEVTEEFLQGIVPDSFPESHKKASNEDGTFDLVPMTWQEYSGHPDISTMQRSTNNKVILPIGKRELPYYNRFNFIESPEFYAWVNFFGIERIKTKSETRNLILSPENIRKVVDIKQLISQFGINSEFDLRKSSEKLKEEVVEYFFQME